jgi:hypothetical protein
MVAVRGWIKPTHSQADVWCVSSKAVRVSRFAEDSADSWNNSASSRLSSQAVLSVHPIAANQAGGFMCNKGGVKAPSVDSIHHIPYRVLELDTTGGIGIGGIGGVGGIGRERTTTSRPKLRVKLSNAYTCVYEGDSSPHGEGSSSSRAVGAPYGRSGTFTGSVWRVRCDEGYVRLSDLVLRPGEHGPPSSKLCTFTVDQIDGQGTLSPHGALVVRPTGYLLVGKQLTTERSPLALWLPVPPPDYVACGCVATSGEVPTGAAEVGSLLIAFTRSY